MKGHRDCEELECADSSDMNDAFIIIIYKYVNVSDIHLLYVGIKYYAV